MYSVARAREVCWPTATIWYVLYLTPYVLSILLSNLCSRHQTVVPPPPLSYVEQRLCLMLYIFMSCDPIPFGGLVFRDGTYV